MILPESIFSYLYISHRQNYLICKRAPLCIPPAYRTGKQKASITIEAALVMPFFFFALLALCCMLEVVSVRTSIRAGLQYAGKIAAEKAYERPFLIPGNLEEDLVSAAGSERLDRSIVEGGSSGIHCDRSYMSPLTGILELEARYRVCLPLPVFGHGTVPMAESCRVKGWNGYEKSGFSEKAEDIVYMTETGMVYHRDYHCSYLKPSVQLVPGAELERMRNKSGGKYYPCQNCGHLLPGGAAYITDYGDRYHTSLGCSGLKRTIYAVPLSEAVGKGVCSKCG